MKKEDDFVVFRCKKCGNRLFVKKTLLADVYRMFKGWHCNECGTDNTW